MTTTTTNQPTDSQISYLGGIWGLTQEYRIIERAAGVLGIPLAHARKGRISYSDIEGVIKRALDKRGLVDTRHPELMDVM